MSTTNIWAGPVSLRGRKSCPNCKRKLVAPQERIWAMGMYVCGKFRKFSRSTEAHCCRECFTRFDRQMFLGLFWVEGKNYAYKGRHATLPWWMWVGAWRNDPNLRTGALGEAP